MEKITVLIADDHPFFRDGLRVLLDSTTDMMVVGEASSGDEVVALAAEFQPQIILMDLKMPGMNGIEATRQILQRNSAIAVLVVTMFEDDASVFAAMRAGSRGYLLKGADKEEMLLAIRAAHRGEAIFGPAIAKRLIQYFSGLPPIQLRQQFPELSEREREILDLMAAGRNNEQISNQLALSLKTVRNYVSNIFSKLRVADRAQAIVRAREAGLGKEPM